MKYISATFFLLFSIDVEALTLRTARSQSFIGGASVSPYVMDGASLNPAALSLRGSLAFGGGFTDGYRGDADHEKTFYGWISDSLYSAFDSEQLTETRSDLMSFQGFPVAASFSFVDSKTTGVAPVRFRSYNLNLSKIIKKKWALGLGINAADAEERASGGEDFFYWFGNLGLIYKWNSRLNFGLSYLNFFESGEDNKPGELRRDPQIQAGFSYQSMEFFQVFADLNYNTEAESFYLVGAIESKMGSYGAFRLSLGYDDLIEDFKLGTGLSFLGPKLQMHYGVSFDLDSGSALHSVDFSLPL